MLYATNGTIMIAMSARIIVPPQVVHLGPGIGAVRNVGSIIAKLHSASHFHTCDEVVLTLCKFNCWYFTINKPKHTMYQHSPWSSCNLNCDVRSSAFADVPTSKSATYNFTVHVVQSK